MKTDLWGFWWPDRRRKKPVPDSWMDRLGTLIQAENELLLHCSSTKGLPWNTGLRWNPPLYRVWEVHLTVHFVWRETWARGTLDGGKWSRWMIRGLGVSLENQGKKIYERGLCTVCTKGEDLFHMLMLTRELHWRDIKQSPMVTCLVDASQSLYSAIQILPQRAHE